MGDATRALRARIEVLTEALRGALQEMEHVRGSLGSRATPMQAMDLARGIALAIRALETQ